MPDCFPWAGCLSSSSPVAVESRKGITDYSQQYPRLNSDVEWEKMSCATVAVNAIRKEVLRFVTLRFLGFHVLPS